MGINGRIRPWKQLTFAIGVLAALGGPAISPRRVASQEVLASPPSDDALALFDRMLAFARSHPRVRGRFTHTYLDRSRTIELHNHGTFTVELPRARIEMSGGEVRSIALDESFARVIVPDGSEPLALSFRLDTTPLPLLFAALRGEAPLADLFSVRRIVADGDAVLELRPIDPAALVDRIWLELAHDGSITRFLVVDTLGGTHRVSLEDQRYPARIPDSLFTLELPPGVAPIEP